MSFTWKGKGTRLVKTTSKKNKIGLTLFNFKTYYKAIVIKTVWWYQHNKRYRETKLRV